MWTHRVALEDTIITNGLTGSTDDRIAIVRPRDFVFVSAVTVHDGVIFQAAHNQCVLRLFVNNTERTCLQHTVRINITTAKFKTNKSYCDEIKCDQ